MITRETERDLLVDEIYRARWAHLTKGMPIAQPRAGVVAREKQRSVIDDILFEIGRKR